VSYERLEGYKSLQRPVASDGTDEPLLYTKEFAFPDGKVSIATLNATGSGFRQIMCD
jgi:formate dehydrogenase major subunit